MKAESAQPVRTSGPGQATVKGMLDVDNVYYLSSARGANGNPVLHTRKQILRGEIPQIRSSTVKTKPKTSRVNAQASASPTIICLLTS